MKHRHMGTCSCECCQDAHSHRLTSTSSFIGLAVHAACDGLALAATFLAGEDVGLIATIGMCIHKFVVLFSLSATTVLAGDDSRKAYPRLLGFSLITPVAGIVFFLREYFAGIPDDLLGSARLDGLDDMGIFFRIVMPLSVPAVVAQLVLTFVGKYNDFMGPLIYLTDNEMYTLQIYMRSFTSGSIYNNRVAAACAISIAPLLLAYLFLQKIILSGIAMSSGLKA